MSTAPRNWSIADENGRSTNLTGLTISHGYTVPPSATV